MTRTLTTSGSAADFTRPAEELKHLHSRNATPSLTYPAFLYFRPGRSGACEARLFLFTGQTHGEAEPPVKQIAACNLQEAMTYMRKRHAEFDILRVEFLALIEMLSGSPVD